MLVHKELLHKIEGASFSPPITGVRSILTPFLPKEGRILDCAMAKG
jgi:hypothetical protein